MQIVGLYLTFDVLPIIYSKLTTRAMQLNARQQWRRQDLGFEGIVVLIAPSTRCIVTVKCMSGVCPPKDLVNYGASSPSSRSQFHGLVKK